MRQIKRKAAPGRKAAPNSISINSLPSSPKQSSCLDAGLEYLVRGFSVIPIGHGTKKPLMVWKEFQRRRANETEVRAWFKKFPNANIGIVTGKISGLVVVDIEKGGSVEGLPPTAIVETGGGGFHYYYQNPDFEIRNDAKKLRPLVDIRGEGGYVVAPPSLHKSGKRYHWKESHGLN